MSAPLPAPTRGYLRRREEGTHVAQVELFYDLVYVFAVTQLSHRLLQHPTPAGALQTALLLAMVWLAWVYTTWVTNWLDPERLAVRALLLALMLVGLLLSVGLPGAFGDRGLLVGITYATAQIGRSAFAVWALRGEELRSNYERILAWCLASGSAAVVGGIVHGHARELLWVLAVGIDLVGGAVGFFTPRLGRSQTEDWKIEGNHFAERCQAFVLIALGESVVVIGATLSSLPSVSASQAWAFAGAFAGAIAFWWLYFDRSAEGGARVIASAADPGALGRSAYHFIHPILIGGIIVSATADERVLQYPSQHASGATAWLILGGTGLYLFGHAAFQAVVWRVVPRARVVATIVVALLGIVAPFVSGLVLGLCAVAVLAAVAVVDRVSDHELSGEVSPLETVE
jgi:low temperature requirement protein LtrA